MNIARKGSKTKYFLLEETVALPDVCKVILQVGQLAMAESENFRHSDFFLRVVKRNRPLHNGTQADISSCKMAGAAPYRFMTEAGPNWPDKAARTVRESTRGI